MDLTYKKVNGLLEISKHQEPAKDVFGLAEINQNLAHHEAEVLRWKEAKAKCEELGISEELLPN